MYVIEKRGRYEVKWCGLVGIYKVRLDCRARKRARGGEEGVGAHSLQIEGDMEDLRSDKEWLLVSRGMPRPVVVVVSLASQGGDKEVIHLLVCLLRRF